MPGKTLNQSDLLTGIVFGAIGIAAIWLGQQHALGTPMRMGPGFFPVALGGLLLVIGLILAGRSLMRGSAPVAGFKLRPALLLPGALVLFSMTVRPLGLALASVLLIFCCVFGGQKVRPLESVVLAVVASALTILVFVVLLKMPISIWPTF